MDKDLKKLVLIANDIGETIINPDVVKIIKEFHHVIMSDDLADQLLKDSCELAKIKIEKRNEERGK